MAQESSKMYEAAKVCPGPDQGCCVYSPGEQGLGGNVDKTGCCNTPMSGDIRQSIAPTQPLQFSKPCLYENQINELPNMQNNEEMPCNKVLVDWSGGPNCPAYPVFPAPNIFLTDLEPVVCDGIQEDSLESMGDVVCPSAACSAAREPSKHAQCLTERPYADPLPASSVCAICTQPPPIDPGACRGECGSLGRHLMLAASEGNMLQAARLVTAGASVNYYAPGKWTPLHRAAGRGHTEVVALLLQGGAYVEARTCYGFTPLDAAARGDTWGHCVALLLAAGARVSSKDRSGRTPLHHAVDAGNSAAVKVLLRAGASRRAKDYSGKMPSHYARLPKIRQMLASQPAATCTTCSTLQVYKKKK